MTRFHAGADAPDPKSSITRSLGTSKVRCLWGASGPLGQKFTTMAEGSAPSPPHLIPSIQEKKRPLFCLQGYNR